MEKEEYGRLFELEEHLWWFVGMGKISLTLLNRFLEDQSQRSILDAGCGTGGMVEHLRTFGAVTGVDLSSQALDYGRHRHPGRLARG